MDLVGTIPRRYGAIAGLADDNPEYVVGLRGLKPRIWMVDSNNTNPVRDGRSWDGALTTINGAIAVMGVGDKLLLAPGHAEALTAAAAVLLSTAGVHVIGMGMGGRRAIFTYTTAVGASFDVTGASVTIENVIWRPFGIDAVTAAVNIQAADCTIIGCQMQHATAAGQATLGILTTAAADRLSVIGCKFYGTSDAGTNAAIRIVGGDAIEIRACIFSGAYASGTGPIENVTTACTNCIVADCAINNLTASCTKAMVFVSTSTGHLIRNGMQVLSGTAPVTGAAMSWAGGSYYAATIGTLSVLT